MDNTVSVTQPSGVVPRGDTNAIMNSIVDTYRKDQRPKKYKKPRKNLRKYSKST